MDKRCAYCSTCFGKATYPAVAMHLVDALFLYDLACTLAQWLVTGVLGVLKEGGQGGIKQEIGGDEICPDLEVVVEKGKVIMQCARLWLNLARLGLGLDEIVEQRVERAGMTQFVLGHSGGGHCGL